MFHLVIPAKAGIQNLLKILDAPVSSTGQAYQVRHDEFNFIVIVQNNIN